MIFVASDLEPSREHPHVPGPSLWPVGLAVGVVVLLVGFVVSRGRSSSVGALITIVFGFLWIRDLTRGSDLAEAPEVEPERRPPRPATAAAKRRAASTAADERYSRNVFLEVSTLGLGARDRRRSSRCRCSASWSLPPFLKQGCKDVDLGPLADVPRGQVSWSRPSLATRRRASVSRKTAFVRNNGFLGKQPSYTIISNHCAHLGCPVQPNGAASSTEADAVQGRDADPGDDAVGLRLPVPRRPVRHRGQPHRRAARALARPLLVLDRQRPPVPRHAVLGRARS